LRNRFPVPPDEIEGSDGDIVSFPAILFPDLVLDGVGGTAALCRFVSQPLIASSRDIEIFNRIFRFILLNGDIFASPSVLFDAPLRRFFPFSEITDFPADDFFVTHDLLRRFPLAITPDDEDDAIRLVWLTKLSSMVSEFLPLLAENDERVPTRCHDFVGRVISFVSKIGAEIDLMRTLAGVPQRSFESGRDLRTPLPLESFPEIIRVADPECPPRPRAALPETPFPECHFHVSSPPSLHSRHGWRAHRVPSVSATSRGRLLPV
jgi:hypothetical protein